MNKIQFDINKFSTFISNVVESYLRENNNTHMNDLLKESLFLEAASRENIIDAIYEDGRYSDIDDDILLYCIKHDNSAKLKLAKWMLDVFALELKNGRDYEELSSELQATVSFMESVDGFQPFSYKSFKDAMNAMFEMKGKNNYSISYQDNFWTVIIPTNAFALKYVILHKLKKTDNRLCVIYGANGKSFKEWYDQYSDNGKYIYYILYNKADDEAYLLNSNPKYKQELRTMDNYMVTFSALKNTDNLSAWFLETQDIDLFDTGTEATKKYILSGNYYVQHHPQFLNVSLYDRNGECLTDGYDLAPSTNNIQVNNYGNISIVWFDNKQLIGIFFIKDDEIHWEITWDLHIDEEDDRIVFSGDGQMGYREVGTRHKFIINVNINDSSDIIYQRK